MLRNVPTGILRGGRWMRKAAFQQVKRAGGFYAAGAYTLRLPGKMMKEEWR